MNLRFNSIDIENFRSIERAIVDLANQGTVIVKGINEYEDKATSNGSGKSSIFEAIIFALFEETSSGEKDVANRVIDNGYTITLKFEIDNDEYTIVRQCTGSKTSVTFLKNGLDISARNKTDTNKLILNVLGISKSIFLDSIFLSQNANTNLASLSPTARKERLEILTNTDSTIATFKEQLKEKQVEYEAKCVEDQMAINKLKGNKEANLKQQSEIQFKINQIQMEIENLKQLGDLKEIETQITQIETVQIPTIDNQIAQIDKDIELKEQEIVDLRKQGEENIYLKDEMEKAKQKKLDEWNKLDAGINANKISIHYCNQNIERIDKDIINIQNSDKCPTCGRKYDDANDEHINQKIAELNTNKQAELDKIAAINTQNQELASQQESIAEEGKEIGVEIIKVSALVEEHKKIVNTKEQERKALNDNKQALYLNKNTCQSNVNALKDKKEKILKTQIRSIDELEEMLQKIATELTMIDSQIETTEKRFNENNDYVGVVKNCVQLVTKEFRTFLLQNSLQYLNKLLAQYSNQLFSNAGDVIKIEEDDTKLNIKLGNATYESLSGGERTRVNIALLLAQKSLASSIGNISCNLIILDEILGYCDSQAEENVISLLTQELETLESIYMVSHKEIPIGYDAQLTVLKDKQGLSRVVSR